MEAKNFTNETLLLWKKAKFLKTIGRKNAAKNFSGISHEKVLTDIKVFRQLSTRIFSAIDYLNSIFKTWE